MVTALLSLTGALAIGGAGFLGGIAARRLSPAQVATVVALVGLLVLSGLGTALIGGTASSSALLWGAVSGVTGAASIMLVYGSLALGPMSVLAPMTALMSALVPMTVGLTDGEKFTLRGYVALGVAAIAIVLIAYEPRNKTKALPSWRAVLMASGAGLLSGLYLVIISKTPDDSGVFPLVVNRATECVVLFTVVALYAMRALVKSGRSSFPSPSRFLRGGVMLALLCGVLDVIGALLLMLAVRIGDLSIVSVLGATYPAGTVLLAAIVLKERITMLQGLGLLLMLIASGLFAV